jgi:hypothetical protein
VPDGSGPPWGSQLLLPLRSGLRSPFSGRKIFRPQVDSLKEQLRYSLLSHPATNIEASTVKSLASPKGAADGEGAIESSAASKICHGLASRIALQTRSVLIRAGCTFAVYGGQIGTEADTAGVVIEVQAGGTVVLRRITFFGGLKIIGTMFKAKIEDVTVAGGMFQIQGTGG